MGSAIILLAPLLLSITVINAGDVKKSVAEVFLGILELVTEGPRLDVFHYIATYEDGAYANDTEFQEAVFEICTSTDANHHRYEDIRAGCQIIYEYAKKTHWNRPSAVPKRMRTINGKETKFLSFLVDLGEALLKFRTPSAVVTTAMDGFIQREWKDLSKNAAWELEYCQRLRGAHKWYENPWTDLGMTLRRSQTACEYLARKFQKRNPDKFATAGYTNKRRATDS